MGFLDKLRGGGDATIQVTCEPQEARPGDAITVRFDVGGELDDKCRGVRVGLHGVGRYLVEERDRDADGDIDRNQVWRSIELFEEEHTYPAQVGPGQASFTVPADAAPSSKDAVEWIVAARVDRERGRDRVERVPLTVRRAASAIPAGRAEQRTDDGLTLDGVPVAVEAGGQLSGQLTVNLADDVKVTAARIRLHRRCTYVAETITDPGFFRGDLLTTFVFSGSRSRITRNERVAELDLTGKREFTAGAVEQLAFTLPVPAGVGPTTAHPHATVEWRLEAVLDRRLRGDLSVETPLLVV